MQAGLNFESLLCSPLGSVKAKAHEFQNAFFYSGYSIPSLRRRTILEVFKLHLRYTTKPVTVLREVPFPVEQSFFSISLWQAFDNWSIKMKEQ